MYIWYYLVLNYKYVHLDDIYRLCICMWYLPNLCYKSVHLDDLYTALYMYVVLPSPKLQVCAFR